MKECSASYKAIKSSPEKLKKITNSIKKLKASEALKLLQFSKLKLSTTVRDVLFSAVSNAENNHNMNVDELYIQKIEIGRSFGLRRFSARGRGKSSKIVKPYSKIKIIVKQKDSQVIKNKKEKK